MPKKSEAVSKMRELEKCYFFHNYFKNKWGKKLPPINLNRKKFF